MVLDIGTGTGRLAFTVAPFAATVMAVEPVENLRRYVRAKAGRLGFDNVFVVDGLIQDVPLPDGFADITMSGHVFGDNIEAEYRELVRVTRPGGMIIFCPGTFVGGEEESHEFLVEHGFDWSTFEEPEDGLKRKYWKMLA